MQARHLSSLGGSVFASTQMSLAGKCVHSANRCVCGLAARRPFVAGLAGLAGQRGQASRNGSRPGAPAGGALLAGAAGGSNREVPCKCAGPSDHRQCRRARGAASRRNRALPARVRNRRGLACCLANSWLPALLSKLETASNAKRSRHQGASRRWPRTRGDVILRQQLQAGALQANVKTSARRSPPRRRCRQSCSCPARRSPRPPG